MSRLKSINKSPKKQKIFHIMAFTIFCPKHRKIAVSDNFEEQKELALWFPFVYLSSDIENRITVEGKYLFDSERWQLSTNGPLHKGTAI